MSCLDRAVTVPARNFKMVTLWENYCIASTWLTIPEKIIKVSGYVYTRCGTNIRLGQVVMIPVNKVSVVYGSHAHRYATQPVLVVDNVESCLLWCHL